MISTIAVVVAFGALFGYIDPATCVNENVEGWSSCEAAAKQNLYTFWIALAIAIASYGSYRVRKWVYRNNSDS